MYFLKLPNKYFGMAKSIIISVTLLLSLSFGFGQSKFSQPLGNIASINFPAEPKVLDTLGQKLYGLKTDSCNYTVVIGSINSDEDFEKNPNSLDKFFEGIVKGVLKKSNGELLTKKNIAVYSHRGIEIEYYFNRNEGERYLVTQQSIYAERQIFNLSIWEPVDKKVSSKAKTDFLNSFKIVEGTKKVVEGSQASIDTPYGAGYAMGQALFYISIPVIIFLLYRNSKKKKAIKEIDSIGRN